MLPIMNPTKLKISGALAFALAAIALLGPRARVGVPPLPVDVPGDVEAYVRDAEAAVPGLRPGDGKRIVWNSPEDPRPTPLAVVYLHGFSADPHEIDPVPQMLADSLGANLFLTRLTGHGLRDGEGLAGASASDWLRDAEEAMAVGRRLGERVVLMGTSTGGTLAVWLAEQPRWKDRLAALILVSPNFGPRDPSADLLLWPWGGVLARLAVGRERCWTPMNEEQARHWTTCYPTGALLPMMALVEEVRTSDLSAVHAPTLAVLSPLDEVVDAEVTAGLLPTFASEVRELVTWPDGLGDPSHHVLAGDIVSPEGTPRLVAEALRFLRAHVITEVPNP